MSNVIDFVIENIALSLSVTALVFLLLTLLIIVLTDKKLPKN